MEQLQFLTPDQVRAIAQKFGSPVYVYDENRLRAAATAATNFPNAFGLTARFAMKACPNASILRIFDSCGMHIDASSGYEVERAIRAGIRPSKILLSSQELAHNLATIAAEGVELNACSLRQISAYGEKLAGRSIGLRFNPGLGSGGTKRTNVGGPASSFGIWHEDIELAKELVAKHQLKVARIHTHIGSGSDPEIWKRVAGMSIALLDHFPEATILNLGGGFKVGRMKDEVSSILSDVGQPVVEVFEEFYAKTKRKIHLEIEPGTYMVALAGSIIARIDDITSTGAEGYTFYKTTTGMTDVLRPSIYGAQHPLIVVPQTEGSAPRDSIEAVVVGHCCESGDILTPLPGDPEGLQPRKLMQADIGDYLVVEGAGAYCSSMSTKNYNSFPESPELLLRSDGSLALIRERQTLEQMLSNEILL